MFDKDWVSQRKSTNDVDGYLFEVGVTNQNPI